MIIKPNFSTLDSIIKNKPNFLGTQNTLCHDDSFRDLIGFDSVVIYEKYILSQNPADILSFDNYFLETDNAQGMIFKGRRSGIFHKWTMTLDPGYNMWKSLLQVLVVRLMYKHYF